MRKGYGRFRKKDSKICKSYERLYNGKKKEFFEKMVQACNEFRARKLQKLEFNKI